jgi:HEAT repeat protein
MLGAPSQVDYKPKPGPTKNVSAPAGGTPQAARRPGSAAPGPDPHGARSDDFGTVEAFLNLLARATRQFHTYPPTSPLCLDAIAACHKLFTSLDRREGLTLRVTPNEFIVDEIGVGAKTIVEQELVQRLHGAHVAALDIDRMASTRDFARFCSDIVLFDDHKSEITFAELLAEHGVEAIVPQMAHRPEVLNVGAPTSPVSKLVENEQQRRPGFAPGMPVTYLYPPEKGWVRMDPVAEIKAVSIVDLAVLVDNPSELATMLLRLTGDEPAGGTRQPTALEQKFSDVATLFSSLDPRLARVMFEKLSRAVLQLDPERRKALLQRTVLPGLLDGRAEGTVLRDFPDVDLAQALCLLLELETAAPEVLTAALDRLELPSDRREKVEPLIRAELKREGSAAGLDESGLDRYARQLIRVDVSTQKSFSEYAAFDLSIDDRAAAVIAGVGDTIAATDLPIAQLRCLWSLTQLEPNPTVVDAFLRRGLMVLSDLERATRWEDLTASVARYRQLSYDLEKARPDVADAIHKGLIAFCNPERTLSLAALSARDPEGHRLAHMLANAYGTALAPSLVTLLDDPAVQSKARPLVPLMCEHADLLAPALVTWLGECGAGAARAIVRTLGYAGTGYEQTLSATLEHRDEPTRREALRALARVGTNQAAALVARQVRNGSPSIRSAAEEALWHFTPAQTSEQLRELLSSREFVLQNPQVVTRLLDRAAQAGTDGLQQALADLESLRFRFWKRGLVRIAHKARELRAR